MARPRSGPGRAARLAGAAAAALLLAAGLAACGGGGGAAAAATSITIATGALPSVADPDPASTDDGQSIGYLSRQMSGTLFSYNGLPENPDTAPTPASVGPELATAATASEDGLTWTVTLRQGVLSQWGNPFSSADVVWTIKRALDRNTSAATNLALINLDTADPVTALDDHTVEIHLTQPSHLFEEVTAIPSLMMMDSKAVTDMAGPDDPWGYEWLTRNSASFGPYQVGTVELPGRILMTANPNYWRGPAAITSVTFVAMAEQSTRLQAVLTGQVDYAPSLDAKALDELESSAVAAPYIQTAAGISLYALFVLNNPEVADVRLRQAMSMAIDREAIVATALNGVGSAATGCLPEPLAPPDTPLDLTPTPQVEQARALVEQVPGPHQVTIGYASAYPGGGSIIPEILKSNFEAIGIEVTLKPYSSYTTWFADVAAGKFGVGMGAFGPYVRDASYMFHNLLVSSSAYNAGSFRNPAFDAATAQAWSGLDEATRDSGLTDACTIVMQEAPWAMLGQATGFVGISKRLTPFSATTAIVYDMRVAGA